MKSVALAVLLLAAPAFAQSYPGDDDSYDEQQPPPAQQPPAQGGNSGYGNTGTTSPYGEQPPGQQGDGTPPPRQYDPNNFRQPPMPPPSQGPTYEDFRDDPSLQSNGIWVESPEYGTVWRPTRVSMGWQPYLYGRWAWTDAGWAWVSEEPFGWATYHYGRWAVLDDGGWAWLPGRVWAPSWVAWRYDDGFAAWCPLGPRGYIYDQPRQWVAVDNRHFLDPVRSYVVPIQRRQEIIYRAQVYRGPRYGPTPLVIGRATGTVVRPLVIRDGGERHTQVNGGSVQFFRPRTAPVVVNRPQARPLEPNRPEGEHRYVEPYGNPHRPEVQMQQRAETQREVTEPRQPPHPNQPQPPPRAFTQPTRPPPQRPAAPAQQQKPVDRHEEKK
jgi:hypothetical protein